MMITEKKDSKSKRKIIIICAVAIGSLATVNIVLLILLLQSGGGPGRHGAVNVGITENPTVISSRLEESKKPDSILQNVLEQFRSIREEKEKQAAKSKKPAEVIITDKINVEKGAAPDVTLPRCYFIFEVTNNSADRTIVEIQGSVHMSNSAGQEFLTLPCDLTDISVGPDETSVEDGIYLYIYEDLNETRFLYSTDYDDLIFEYKTNTIIYSDGGQSLPNEDWLRP